MDIGKLFRDAWGLFVKDAGPLIVGMLVASIVPAVAAVIIAAATIGASLSGLHVNARGDVTGVEGMNWALLIIGSVAIIVVAVLLSVPLYVGILAGVLRRVREGREMAYGDAFTGFGLFAKVIWATVLLGLIFTAIFVVPTAVLVGGALARSWILVGLGVVVLLAAMVAYAYLGVSWVYVFPAIVDRRIGVGEAMGESRSLVHGSGWWWTFLALFVLQLVVGAVSFALGLIPLIGAVATIVLYPFVLTWVVAMYFQARSEGALLDAVLGWPRQPPAGPPAYSVSAAPYGSAPVPPAPPAPLAPHVHAASEIPTVDVASGQLEKHCSQCGALIEGSDEFCQVCALEASGGEPPAAPEAPEAPKP